jgi:Fe-S-cluster-containing hydrogenase component 2
MAESALEKLAGGDEFLKEFFEYLLSREEAEFLLLLPRSALPITFGELVEKSGMTEAKVEQILETLIHKTMVEDFETEAGKRRLYGLSSLIAWTENYMHRYIDLNAPNQLDIHVRFGQWWEAVKHAYTPAEGKPRTGRLIPIETTITDTRGVIPTTEASKVVDEADYISVMRCPCRSSGHLAGNACDNPMEVCFSMNDYARFQVEYGYAREVTKEWAKKTLRECEEHGLAHVTDNIRGNYNMLCNCCSCHCIGLVGYTKANQANVMAKTGFLCSVDPDACTASGDCAEKCSYDAISVVEGKARVDEDRCIGCGVCTTACPTEALSLKVRPPEKTERYYESMKEYFEEDPPIDGDIENAKYVH